MAPTKRPNFLVIVADDLGFSDTSPFGGEIDTPNLMKIAMEGLRLTGFHTAASCSPTRAMLLSGTDAHIAGLGAMAEHMRRFPHVFADKPGYEGYLNSRVAAMPEILQDNGYHTVMSGKWHLGLTKETAPCSRGFTKVFSTLPGAGNHYNHEPQLYDTTEKPRAFLKGNKGLWMEGDDFIDGEKDLPKDFYSSNSFTDYFLKYMRERTDEEKEKPFFGYLAFTAPHWPLQAPPETVKKYKGWYDDGPMGLRNRRLKSLTEKGIVPKDVEPAPIHTLDTIPWAELSKEEQAKSCRAMEIFAAMVDLIDVNVGRVVEYLKSTDELDNTFIVFMSDNGAEGALLEAIPILAGATMGEVVQKYYDNSYENMGNHNSFVWYGPQWAGAATAPSRGAKAYSTEGGIRCPCIVRYPPSISQQRQGSIDNTFTTVMDILPTFLDLAGVQHPAPTFRSRDVASLRGKSWTPLLSAPESNTVSIYNGENDIVGWEQIGVAAVRLGEWKALFLPPPKGPGKWELYHVSEDLGELHDLADKEPKKLAEMIAHYETYFQETGMFDAYEITRSEMAKMKQQGKTR